MPTDIPTEGIFAVYKERGMTSHDVVDAVRRATGQKRVGHAGTLDPLAKGVLVVGVGRAATRMLGQLAEKDKEYVTRIRLGARSTTDDGEGKKQEVPVDGIPSEEDVRTALHRFRGVISQRPPTFSALKIQGRPAYRLARKNHDLELAPREVEVKAIELLAYEWPWVDVRVVTGPGVYIRAIARDLGDALGTGGYVEELERVRVGAYTADQAMRMCDLRRGGRSTQTP
ncbi:MAG TPA: tRNA pseudouridine(55) synthase TruB [Sedimentisphaerales bacterium]|nr:tRNA pseudouridine(55) synthase TruB [Sedimentisphaerales bacterium]HRS11016.1 tRNA pseudouridine(55) synthase TruB [Sedimentisphaerales bacterium]HRV49268.1 tRNA pseudouridine(55) synthase TruB [Sedimentisphaerales bacterium]